MELLVLYLISFVGQRGLRVLLRQAGARQGPQPRRLGCARVPLLDRRAHRDRPAALDGAGADRVDRGRRGGPSDDSAFGYEFGHAASPTRTAR